MQIIKRKRHGGRPYKNPTTYLNMKGRPILKKQIVDYLKHCEKGLNHSPRTIEHKRYCFNQFVRYTKCKSLQALTNKEVDDWIVTLAENNSGPVAINHCISQLVVMLRYYRDMNYELSIKIALINKQKVPDKEEKMSYTRQQIEKALFYADLREWLMISIFFDTGMRLSELQRLRLENFNGRDITFIAKGRKLNFAMISQKTYEKMKIYVKKYKITDYLFPGRDKSVPISRQQIERLTKRVFAMAGFPEFHPHMLRHSFAMDLLTVQGLSVREIQQLINHTKLETTEHYLDRITKEQKKKLWEEQRFRTSCNKRPIIKIVENSSI